MDNQGLPKKSNENWQKGSSEDSVSGLIKGFASSTTAHGVGRIAESSDFRFRVTWFLVWLGVMISFTIMVVKLSLLYASKPVSTSISIVYEESLAFPGITVCNLNMILMSKVNDIKKSMTPIMDINRTENSMRKDFFGSSRGSMTSMNRSNLKVDPVTSGVLDILTDINNLPLETRKSKGYQASAFLVYCSWAGLMCGYSSYFGTMYWRQSWNWKYGNCFTFNGYTSVNGEKVQPLVSTASEGSEGLTLILDINHKEYLPGLTAEEGIRILIGDQDEPLFPVEKGISIEPGVSASISIRKSIIEREDTYGNGSCKTVSNENVKYSIQDCISNCKATTQGKKCNCTDAKYFGITPLNICDTDFEKMCVMLVNSNFSRGIFDCTSTCPPPCKDIVFHKTVTQSKVFPAGYQKLHSRPMPPGYVSNNIIQVKIFFEDQTVQKVSSGVYYLFDNLVSDIGGQLGLWIGVSAVTCMEFFALVWNLILYLMYRRKRKGQVSFDVK